MKFPISHCIPTSLLTKELYSDLICRMVSDGHVNIIPHLSYELVVMWDYLGVSIYGDINTYDHPHSFMGINGWMNYRDLKDENYPNILNKQWLEEYLK